MFLRAGAMSLAQQLSVGSDVLAKLSITGGRGDERQRSFAGIADLAEMRLHAACNAPIDGVGAELLDVRVALFCYPGGPRKPCRAAHREFADVRLQARVYASFSRLYAGAQGLEID